MYENRCNIFSECPLVRRCDNGPLISKQPELIPNKRNQWFAPELAFYKVIK